MRRHHNTKGLRQVRRGKTRTQVAAMAGRLGVPLATRTVMIRVRQHIPNFVEGATAKVAEAETQEELLAVPWIASYAKDVEPVEREGTVTGWPDGVETTVHVIHAAPEEQRFHQFSLSDDMLMVEHNGGIHHWVVGRVVEGLDQLTLPPWIEHPEARQRREAWNRGEWKQPPAPYRCAEHGIPNADCCLGTWKRH